MKLTKEWLKEKSACKEGYEWFIKQDESDAVKVLRKLMLEDHFNWANWTICRLFGYKQKIQYAVFASEQVLPIFEKKYPKDDRPRKAIEAAKKCIEDPSTENKADAAAYDAADAAADAVDAAAADAVDADAARKEMQIKILEYGIKLLESEV